MQTTRPNPNLARRYHDVRAVADYLGVSVPTVWRGVRIGTLPKPCYPTPGAARWDMQEIEFAMNATKATPIENLIRRRPQGIVAREAEAALANQAA